LFFSTFWNTSPKTFLMLDPFRHWARRQTFGGKNFHKRI
jgi:hypothetical protein